jgi:hypothetical protein
MDAEKDTELKYLVERDVAEEFITRCNGHVSELVYDPDRPVSYTRTLYLDTADRRFHNIADLPWSCRFRVREYASAANLDDLPILTGTAVLELKQSHESNRRKWRREQPAAAVRALLAGGARARSLPFPIPTLCAGEEPLFPQMSTWYRRISFAAPAVRITIDEAVCFCAAELPGEQGTPAEPRTVLERAEGVVLEVKACGPRPRWLESALRPIGDCSSYSKFRTGMKAIERSDTSTGVTLGLPTLQPERRN